MIIKGYFIVKPSEENKMNNNITDEIRKLIGDNYGNWRLEGDRLILRTKEYREEDKDILILEDITLEVLEPRGFVCNGNMFFFDEDYYRCFKILVDNNNIDEKKLNHQDILDQMFKYVEQIESTSGYITGYMKVAGNLPEKSEMFSHELRVANRCLLDVQKKLVK